MKKLLFVIAIATIGFTTSCTKECSACTVKTSATPLVPVTTTKFSTVELCKAAKAGADASGGVQTYSCD